MNGINHEVPHFEATFRINNNIDDNNNNSSLERNRIAKSGNKPGYFAQ